MSRLCSLVSLIFLTAPFGIVFRGTEEETWGGGRGKSLDVEG